MAVSGHDGCADHAHRMMALGVDILAEVEAMQAGLQHPLRVRIGLSTGGLAHRTLGRGGASRTGGLGIPGSERWALRERICGVAGGVRMSRPCFQGAGDSVHCNL